MKTLINRSLIAFSILAICTTSVFAAGNPANNTTATESLAVKLVQEDENFMILQIKLGKQDTKAALLRIEDGTGELLHSERVSANTMVRYIKVSPYELQDLVITLQTNQGATSKRFKLSTERQTTVKIEEVAQL